MANALSGLGIWIWELSRCEGGSLGRILARCDRAGVAWVAVKCGEKTSNGQVTRALVDGLRAGGIECAAWWYSHPSSVGAELAYLTDHVQRIGVRHLILDAEEPWEREPTDWKISRDWRRQAAAFAQDLRAAVGPDVFLADAPWARPQSHGSPFPYIEFGAVMDARMPQFYWQLAAPEPAPHFLTAADRQWAQLEPFERVWPAGSPVDFTGAHHAPVSEIAAFLDRYAARPAVSLWSWQHLSPAEWALLEQRARARRADPAPPEPEPEPTRYIEVGAPMVKSKAGKE